MFVVRLVVAAAASLVFLGQTQAGVPSPCRPDVCVDRLAPPTQAQDWPAARRHAFARLLTAEAAFVAAVGTDETDRGGSAAGEAEMARDAEHAAFRHTLDAVAQGRPEIAFVDYAVSDAALNAAYRQVMAVDDPAALAWGSIDKAGIRTTQRAWLAYRDAFTAFADTYDATTAAAVTAELTTRRTIRLEGFLGDEAGRNRYVADGRGRRSCHRHRERSDAIQGRGSARLDCFAALAMTASISHPSAPCGRSGAAASRTTRWPRYLAIWTPLVRDATFRWPSS